MHKDIYIIKKDKKNILSSIVIIFISMIVVFLVVFVFVRGYDDKLLSKLSIHSNIESLTIFKNGYDNIFSFNGFIENDALLDVFSILNKNKDIKSTYSTIDLPAFLSIRKASVYIDMSVSEYLTENDIVDGRIYKDGQSEAVIGYDLAQKYNIKKNTVVAVITEDTQNIYNANNFFVTGIAKFNDDIKDSKLYISLDLLSSLIKKSDKAFTQKIDVIVDDKRNMEKVVYYIKENLNTNYFALKENNFKYPIFTRESIKRTYTLVTSAFIIACILIVLSLIRIIIFGIKK